MPRRPSSRNRRASVESLESRTLMAIFAAVGAQPTGALTGKIVYTVGGHGLTADTDGDKDWSTQRGETNNNDLVEDFGNVDQMSIYADSLWRAGATVVPLRPVGKQVNEVIVDNQDAGFTTPLGTWSNGTSNPYFAQTNAAPTARYRTVAGNVNETAVARFTPTISVAGYYPVYAWALDGSTRLPDQTYRVNHTGGATEVKVNLRRVGKGWIYLGTYYFAAGTSGNVEVSNKTSTSSPASYFAVADAIRFGNGMGDIDRGAGTSGAPRQDEAALYWIEKMAGYTYSSGTTASPVSFTNWRSLNTDTGGFGSNDRDATVSAAPRYARYMNNSADGTIADRLFLSFHSNASGVDPSPPTARGVAGLFNDSHGGSTPNQKEWAQLLGDQINADMVGLSSQLEYAWYNRTNASDRIFEHPDYNFGELNNVYIGGEFDATIVEVAFHDNLLDSAIMLDPKARQFIARAATKASVQYFKNRNAANVLVYAPDAPTDVRAISAANGDVTLSWVAPLGGDPNGGTAAGYRVYSSFDGNNFDGGQAVAGTSLVIPAANLTAAPVYFRVVATNAGGESPLSALVAARRRNSARLPVLLVNGFTRLGRAQDPAETRDIFDTSVTVPGSTLITIKRVRARESNSFDYLAEAGAAIGAYGSAIGFDSVPATAVTTAGGGVNLANYSAVIWLAGEQSTGDTTVSAAAQTAISNYLTAGGKIFISGAELGWDLDRNNNGRTFYNNVLRGDYVQDAGDTADDAGTYNVTSPAGTPFGGLTFSFDNGSLFYNVDFPDIVTASAGSSTILSYSTGTSAGVAYQNGATRVVNIGFPFETITTDANRSAFMGKVLDYFGLAISAATAAPTLAAVTDSGTAGDGLTNFNNATAGKALQFTAGNLIVGAAVRILSGDDVIASFTATATSQTITTNGTFTIGEGARAITVDQTVPNKQVSDRSAATAVTIDTVAPVTSGFAFNDALSPNKVTVTFSESVQPTFAAGDIAVINRGTNATSTPTSASYAAGTNVGTFNFSPFADGNYRATLAATNVTDAAGNPLTAASVVDFFHFTGDANGDRTIDTRDFAILIANFGRASPTYAQGDFNYTNSVNSVDFGLLVSKYGQTLAPAAPGALPSNRTVSTSILDADEDDDADALI